MGEALVQLKTDVSADANNGTQVRRRWLALARAGWLVSAALALLIFLAAIPRGYALRFSGAGIGVPIDAPAWYLVVMGLAHGVVSILAALVSLGLAALLFWKRRDEPMALFVSFFLLAYGIVLAGPLEMLNGFLPLIPEIPTQSGIVISPDVVYEIQSALFAVMPLLFYLFPNGRFVPAWTRYATLLLILLAPALIYVFSNQWLSAMTPFAWLLVAIEVTLLGLGFYAQIYRYRRVASTVERQQTKLAVFGLVITFVLLGLLQIPYAVLQQIPTGVAHPWWRPLTGLGWWLTLTILPISLAVAVMRYRLWDIDIIINRTLVFGTLSAGIVVMYILVVGLLGTLLNTNVNLAAMIVTLTLTALFFQTLRTRLQRRVNRALFGARDAPGQNQENEAAPSDTSWLRRYLFALAQIAWLVCAALASLSLIAAVPFGYAPYIGEATSAYVAPLYFTSAAVSFLVAFVSIALAALLFWKRRAETMALFVSFYLLSYAIFIAGPLEMLSNFFRGQIDLVLISHIASAIYFVPPILLLYLFPNGRFVPRWTRWAGLLVLFIAPIIMATENVLSDPSNPELYLSIFAIGCLLGVGIYAQVYRYRRAAMLVERQQIKWVALGISIYLFLLVVTSVPYLILTSNPNYSAQSDSAWAPVGDTLWWLLVGILPVSLAVPVMRYRLWEVDILIKRTLVYGALTATIIALYIVLVGALGALSQTSGNLLISLLATGLIAFLFQPLRERLQRGINRLMYGERDDPYAVLSKLGQHLESTLAPEAILPTIVETVRAALKLPYTALALKDQDEFHTVAQAGAFDSSMPLTTLPLAYQAEPVGQLILAPRARGEAFTAADLRLLRDIANQAGVAIHNVQLTADLQRSRERLVTAREEERRRLRRNLHDGLGPALASITLKLDAAHNLLKQDADATDELLGELKSQTQSAITDIRRLVYDLRPPALDELGLVSALREQVARYAGINGLAITFDAPEILPPLSAAVEVAAYRIATEALMNVVHHAHATCCVLQLTCEKELRIKVEDNGVGLASDSRAGVGLTSMSERAVELGGTCLVENLPGGGTRVVARIPLAG